MFNSNRFSRIVSFIFISLAVVFTSACGNNSNLDEYVNNSINNGNTLAGQYLGANNLNSGQVGTLDVTVAQDGSASGTYKVTNPTVGQTITTGTYPVTGSVNLTTGTFTLSGTIPGLGAFSISGVLPISGNVANYTITINNQTFTGAIQPASQGTPTPPSNNGGATSKLISSGTLSNFLFTPDNSYNGANPPVSNSSLFGGAVATGSDNSQSATLLLSETSLNGQTATIRSFTVSVVVPSGETLQAGTTYPLVSNGRGAFLTLNKSVGVTAVEGWTIGANTTGSATIVSLDANSITVNFSFNNLVPNTGIANNTATGSFNTSGTITGNFANIP